MAFFPEHVFDELSATRYITAAGLMILLYDHLLTFADEVELIWPAPSTYAKYTFLINRYTVLGTLLTVAYETCGFVETTFSDTGCKQFIFVCSMLAIVSVGIGNLLILQRVVILWEHRPIILKIMAAGFLVSFAAQVVTMIITLIDSLPNITWSRVAGMCIATKSSPVLVAVWASPLLFEVFVLGSTALNALDRPRTVELPIIKALHSDGIGFFLSITCLRVLNLILAVLSRPSLTFLAVFFIWAMTTTVLGRLLLHLRRAECRPPAPASARSLTTLPDNNNNNNGGTANWDHRRSRVISPFGLAPLTKSTSRGSAHSSSSSSASFNGGGDGGLLELELAQVPPVYPHHQQHQQQHQQQHPHQHQFRYHYGKRMDDTYVRPWD